MKDEELSEGWGIKSEGLNTDKELNWDEELNL